MPGAKKKARHSGSRGTTLYASDVDSGEDALELHGVSTSRALGKRPSAGSKTLAWRNDTEGSDDAICLSDGSDGEPDALAPGDRDASLRGGVRHVAGWWRQPTKMPDGRAKQGMRGNCTIHAVCDVIVDQLLQEYDIMVDYNHAVIKLTDSCRAADGAYVLDVLSQINKDQNLLFMQPDCSESHNLLYRLTVKHSEHLNDFSRLYDYMKQPADQMPRYALVAIKMEEDGHDLHLVSARGSFCKDLQKWVWAANSWGPNKPNLYIRDQDYDYHVELSFTIVRVLKQELNYGTRLGKNKPLYRNPPRNIRCQAAAEAQAHAVAAADAAEMGEKLKQELEEVKSKLLETESSNSTFKHEAEKDRARAGEAARECQTLMEQLAELKSKLQAAESSNNTIKREAEKERVRAEEAARAHEKERQALEKELAEQKSKLQAVGSSKNRREHGAEKHGCEISNSESAAEERSKTIAHLQPACADELRQEWTRRDRAEELLTEKQRRMKELQPEKDLLEKQPTGVRVYKSHDALLRSASLGGEKDMHGQASGAGSVTQADDGADAVQVDDVVADALGRTYTCAECGKGKKAAASKCGNCCLVQPGSSGSSCSALPEKKDQSQRRAVRGAVSTTVDGSGVCGGAGQKMAAQDTDGRTEKIVAEAEAQASGYLEQILGAKALDHPTGLRYYGQFDGDVCLHKNLNGEGWCINHGAACGGASEWFVLACYKGEFRNGKMHGEGTVTFKDGDIFAGTMHMDRPSSGVLTKADGSKSEVEYAGQAATCLGPDKPKPKRT